MAFAVADRVKETTTTTGTGAIDLAGAEIGFEGFVSAIGDGNNTYYAIIDNDNGEWEVGVGTVTDATPDTLSRDTVLSSSNSDAKVNFQAGTKQVFVTQPAGKSVYQDNDSGTVTLDKVQLDLEDALPSYSEGLIWYDLTHNTMSYYGDVQGLVHEVGLEEHQKVYNNSGVTIAKGEPLYFSGNFNGYPTAARANSTNVNKYNAQGVAAHSIDNNSYGYVCTAGLVEGVDTSGLTAGQNFFVGLTDGAVQNASPTYPNFPMCLGWVVSSDATDGILLVNQQNHSVNSFRVRTDTHIGGDLIIDGDLTVVGSQTIASSTNVETGAPFLYLNSGDTIGEANTTFTGSGLDDAYFAGHFSGTASTTYYVKIDATGTPDTFSWSKDNFSTTEATGVAITGGEQTLDDGIKIDFGATTGHTLNDVWSGTAAPVDVDTGFWSNRNTGGSGVGYTHVGLFFDVTDSKFKIVDEYDPEPTGTINTGDASFSAGTLVVDGIEGVNGTFSGALSVTGNITVGGTVDGRDVAADGTKLDGIEANATADQTATEIKTAYESNSDTNALTDALLSKLNAIEANATADQTAADIRGLGFFDTSNDGSGSGLDADLLDGNHASAFATLSGANFTGPVGVSSATYPPLLVTRDVGSNTTGNYGSLKLNTITSGTPAAGLGTYAGFFVDDVLKGSVGFENDGTFYVINPSDTSLLTVDGSGNVTVGGTVDGRDIAADGTKLDGIESGATADQSASEILTAIKTVDGPASGLDADLLDGQQGAYYQPASNALTTSTTFGGDVSGTYNAIVVADDSHNHIISNVDGLQTALDAKQAAATALTTSTTFGGDVSGTYNAIVVADDSHNHIISNVDGLQTALDGKLALTGGTLTGAITVSNLDESIFARKDVAGAAWSGRIVSRNDTTNVSSFLGNYNGYAGVFAHNGPLTAWAPIYINNFGGTSTANVYTGTLYVGNNLAFHDGYHPNADTLTTARTINGTSFNGSANITVTANTPNTLTRGSYLTGSNFNGSAATTWAVDATTTATASKVVARDASGDDFRRYGYADYFNMSHTATTRNSDTVFYSSTDAYIRKNNATGMRASLNVPTRTGGDASGTWGISITGNADTVDSLHASSFLRNDTSNSVTNYANKVTFYSNTNAATATASQASLECFTNGAGNDAFMAFHVGGDYATYFGLDGDTNDLFVGGWSKGAARYKIWHAGNDGAGSGLDADTLDGIHESGFMLIDGMRNNTDQYVNFRVMRNSNTSSGNDGMFIGYQNSNQGTTKLYGGGSSAVTMTIGASVVELNKDTTHALNFTAASVSVSRGISFNSRSALTSHYNDGWLRLNQNSEFTNGTYSPKRISSAEQIVAGNSTVTSGGQLVVSNSTNPYFSFHEGGTRRFYIQYLTTDNVAYYNNEETVNHRFNGTGSSCNIQLTTSGTLRGYVSATTSNEVGFLDSDGNWAVRVTRDTDVDFLVNNVEKFSIGTSSTTSANDITVNSDERIKDNIELISNALEKVQAIRGVTFNRTDTDDDTRHAGVIAQEVEKVLPEVVTENAETGIKSVAYANMVGLLIEAIKEQQTQIDDLKAEVTRLKGFD
jgi:hypothetical protein